MDVEARLKALEAENERLRDEIVRLKADHGHQFVAPIEWRLTSSETKVLGRLLAGGLASKNALMDVLYGDRLEEPEIKIVDVFVCKMRKKLTPLGIEVQTVWGRGYQMTDEAKRRVNELISARAAA